MRSPVPAVVVDVRTIDLSAAMNLAQACSKGQRGSRRLPVEAIGRRSISLLGWSGASARKGIRHPDPVRAVPRGPTPGGFPISRDSAPPIPTVNPEYRSKSFVAPAGSGRIAGGITDPCRQLEKLAAEQQRGLVPLQVHMNRILFSIAQRRYGLIQEEAEEVVQEAWLLFLQRRGTIRNPGGWLAGTVANLSRHQIDRAVRSRKRFAAEDRIEDLADGRAGSTETGIAVREALAGLDVRSRTLCRLIAIEGYAYEEVSSRTGVPLGSIGPMYMRARKKLRLALEPHHQLLLAS